jgi:hypothetical protein
MKWPTLNCPFCQGTLRNTDVYPGKPVVCPTCAAKLQPSTSRGRLSLLVGFCLSAAICYFFGLSPTWFVAATIVLWFPITVIWLHFFGRIVPPVFEAFDPQTGHLPKFISLDLPDPSSTQAPEPADSSDSDSDRPAAGARSEQKPLT